MTARTKNLLGLVAFIVAAAAMVWLVRGTQKRRGTAVDAVPAGAFLAATLDIDRLRDSPMGAALRSGPGARLLSDQGLASTCGFDPVERMREIALAVPVEDDSGEFGVAIRADVSKDELVDCARKVIEARGGPSAPTIRESGSFTLVEPEGAGGKRYPTLAYREGGPFLIARGLWLATLIDTVEGRLPSVRQTSEHLALRRELGQTSDDRPSAALVVTVVLPKTMRERIKKDMGDEVAAQAGEQNSAALMAGVLGVESAGLSLAPGDGKGTDATVRVVLHCEDDTACATVARLVDKTRRQWAGDVRARMLGVGTLLENLVVESKASRLSATTRAPAVEAAEWLSRLLELRAARAPGGAASAATPRSPPSSDEVIRPDGGPNAAREGGPAAP